jgi:hypothetical protein
VSPLREELVRCRSFLGLTSMTMVYTTLKASGMSRTVLFSLQPEVLSERVLPVLDMLTKAPEPVRRSILARRVL